MNKMPLGTVNTKNRTSAFVYCLIFCILLLESGCLMVGPDYVQPELLSPEAWHNELNGGLSSDPIDPETLSKWWTVLNDPELEHLETMAVNGSFDLRTARTRVREARTLRSITRAGFLPALGGTGSITRYQTSENNLGTGNTNTEYAMGFDAGWELDLFGGIQRSVEVADAELGSLHETVKDVQVSLMAEVALNYVDVRTYQARITAANISMTAQKESYELNLSSYEAGLINQLAVEQARYNLDRTQSLIPTLEMGLDAAKNRLAVLVGKPPGALHELLAEYKPIPAIPVTMAIGIPARTLRNRPDIRKSERLLAAQTAKIGVATADLYPKFQLVGTLGLESLSTSNLFDSASRAWGIGPSISWNIFNGNAIRNAIKVENIRQEQALITYEASVLKAREEVENALMAYAKEQLRQEYLEKATDAAFRVYDLADDQYKSGLVDYNVVLDARRSLQSLEDELAVSRGKVTSNMIRLYKALGGGWTPETPRQ